jgi:hypothetical protein
MAIYSSVRHHTGRQQVVYRCTVRKQLGDALSGGSSSVQVHYEETVRGLTAAVVYRCSMSQQCGDRPPWTRAACHQRPPPRVQGGPQPCPSPCRRAPPPLQPPLPPPPHARRMTRRRRPGSDNRPLLGLR